MPDGGLALHEIAVPEVEDVADDRAEASPRFRGPRFGPRAIEGTLAFVHFVASFDRLEDSESGAGDRGVAAADDASFEKAMLLEKVAPEDRGVSRRCRAAAVARLGAEDGVGG